MVYKYLVEEGGKIIYAGNKLPALPHSKKQIIKLGERVLLPAFGDGYIHYLSWAFLNTAFNARPAETIDHLLQIIKRQAKKYREAKILFGFGHSGFALAEKRLVNRNELDQAVTDKPVFLLCSDGCSCVVNTKAIGFLPGSLRTKQGFHIETGLLTRQAFFEAVAIMAGRVPLAALLKAFRRGFDTLAGYGLSLIHTMEGLVLPQDRDIDFLRFFGKGAQQQLRIYFQTMDTQKVVKRGLSRVGGCFSCTLDGSLETKEAALLKPYADEPSNSGTLFYQNQRVRDFAVQANRQGLQIRLHCNGDAAVVQAVEALQAALKDTPRADHRHALVHAPLIPDACLKTMAELKIGIVFGPAFLQATPGYLSCLESVLGERAQNRWPLRTMLDMGIKVCGGSAAPALHPNPWPGIYAALNHTNPGQSVTLQEALRLFTYNVAHASFDEKERGSLEKGKIADMMILNKNPLGVAVKDLLKLKVEKLFIAGVEYQKGRKLPGLFLSSMKNRARAL